MSNDELRAQFERCKQWHDPEQWEVLAVLYDERGYAMNALYCFRQAEACRGVAVETEVAYAGQ